MKDTFTDWANLPEPLDPFGDPYKALLESGEAIAAYIATMSSHYVDEQLASEHFRDSRAVLRLLPVDTLRAGHADTNIRDRAKERRYTKLNPLTMPPLVVQAGNIEDGNHRFRIGKKRKQTHFWCYDVE
jgi:hypothetical protein